VIEYDRFNAARLAFSFTGTVLPRILGRVGLLTGFTLALCFLNRYVFEKFEEGLPVLDPLAHSVLGVAMGMLVVFRTNSSNNRYWEGRSHWGMILNSARNLARMGYAYAPPADDLARLISAYVICLKDSLRDATDFSPVRSFVPGRLYEQIARANNAPSMLARAMSEWIASRQREGKLDSMQARQMEQLVCSLLDQQGGCEKIKKTPLPFVYAALIQQLLLLYLYSLPFALIPKMGFAAPLIETVVALGMLGIEEAGVEIENPFGMDLNNLPLEKICETIMRDVKDLTSAEPSRP
jgi:ion channel-forming bestrophin family protein